jgi:hypothetical protein
MHDIDQVALEESPRAPSYEQEDEGYLEFAGEHEGEDESAFEEETAFEEEYGFQGEDEDEEAAEAAELELAAELLEVGSEQELEQFIGNLVRSAAGAVSDFARTREGRQIGGILKQAAGRVLPVLGRSAGRAVGGAVARATGGSPAKGRRAGGQVGGSLGSLAKRYFGLELEGISAEDQEFEVARRFVRFGTDAVRDCLRRLGTGPARQVTQQSVATAGQQWAPGLVSERVLEAPPLRRSTATAANRGPTAQSAAARPETGRPATPGPATQPARSRACPSCGSSPLAARGGRWERRGDAIVLYTR